LVSARHSAVATADPCDAGTWLMITPSYRRDIEQFSLLTESFLRFAPEAMRHLVIVDRADLELFASFVHERMDLVTAEDVLPGRVRKLPLPRSLWISTRFPPVRSWIAQQMMKIQAAADSGRPHVLFADSDVVFLRPFTVDRFTDGSRLALSRVANHYEDLNRWRQSSARLLGLDGPTGFAPMNYVSNLIPWRREAVRAMIERIESVGRRSWFQTVATTLRFSEYTAYGVFCEEVLGLEQAGHYGWDDPILNLCLTEPMQERADFDALLDRTLDEHIGAMFHSKNSFDRSDLRAAVEAFWVAQSDLGTGPAAAVADRAGQPDPAD